MKVCVARVNTSSKERGFSNPRQYADKNVRAPLNSELRAPFGFAQDMLRVRQRTDQPQFLRLILRGEYTFTLNPEEPLFQTRTQYKTKAA